ncbi:hypothetical protein TNCV_4393461 [Trichonephila clavipes]|nr:hypothetical protein TNCV_4393461 [Trichonephila clavipes]
MSEKYDLQVFFNDLEQKVKLSVIQQCMENGLIVAIAESSVCKKAILLIKMDSSDGRGVMYTPVLGCTLRHGTQGLYGAQSLTESKYILGLETKTGVCRVCEGG